MHLNPNNNQRKSKRRIVHPQILRDGGLEFHMQNLLHGTSSCAHGSLYHKDGPVLQWSLLYKGGLVLQCSLLHKGGLVLLGVFSTVEECH